MAIKPKTTQYAIKGHLALLFQFTGRTKCFICSAYNAVGLSIICDCGISCFTHLFDMKWASSQQNLSLGFPTKQD